MQLSMNPMDPRFGGAQLPVFPPRSVPNPGSLFPFQNKQTVNPHIPFVPPGTFHVPHSMPTLLSFPSFGASAALPGVSSSVTALGSAPVTTLPTIPAWALSSHLPVAAPNGAAAQQAALLLARLEHHKAEMERIQQGLVQIEYQEEPTPTSQSKHGASHATSTISRSGSPHTPKKRTADPQTERSTKQVKVDPGQQSDDERDSSKTGNLRGERRLVISFENYGKPGENPQTFGKSGAIIPDGIAGTHTVYNERWRFEITHKEEVIEVDYSIKCVPLTWTITNLTTGVVTTMTETRDEAIIRNTQGQTISNKVFREALECRAKDLELRLQDEINPRRVAQLQSLIRALRPKRFSEGPLIFGLQHRVIQDKMTSALKEAAGKE